MSIKLKRAASWALIILLSWGCANEQLPYFKDTKVGIAGADCLSGIVDEFELFLDGELSDARLKDFWKCADTAVAAIDRFMVGSDENGNFKAEDVRWFIGKYFLKSGQPDGISINDTLLEELMEVKRLFLGGSTKILSRVEVVYTRQIVSEFEAITLQINPHMKLLFGDNKGVDPDELELSRAVSDLSQAFNRFMGLFEKQKATYDINRLVRLVEEIQNIINSKNPNKPKKDWKKYIPIVQKAKGMLLNSSEAQIEGHEWAAIGRVGSQIIELYYRGKHYLNGKSLKDPVLIDQYRRLYFSLDVILREAIKKRNDQPFTNAEFSTLLFTVQEGGLLPFENISVEDIKRYWWVVVDRMLQSPGTSDDGLGLAELDNLTVIFLNWFEAQRHLLGLSTTNEEAVKDITEALNTPWPVRTDSEGRMIFDGKIEPVNLESSTALNWGRVAFTHLVRAYGEDPANGLSHKEVELAFYDLKPLFVQIGLVDKDNNTFHERVIIESNLFTPRADGNARISNVELYEYLHYILTGITAGKNLVAQIPEECTVDTDWVSIVCFRENMKSLFADRFSNMPKMVSYVAKLSDKSWRKFLANMEVATRDNGNENKPIEKGDIYEMAIFMQYIETVMLKFDEDKNGILNVSETLNAFPHFVTTIANITDMDPVKDRKELRNIFTFMLRYGEPPNPKNAISILRYLHWRWTEKKWKISADRGTLVAVLAKLSEE